MQQSDLAEWARAALKGANVAQAELARQLTDALGRSIDRAAVNKMLTGARRIAVDEMTEIARITGAPLPVDRPTESYRPPPQFLGERDLPVYAAAEGGPGQMVVSTEAIEYVPRPWYLGNVKDGFAVLIVGDSMEPAFDAGDMAVVNPRLAPQRDKDVILVKGELEGDFIATVKRLLSWNEREWKLRQFNPRKDFTLPRKEWPRALRVVGKFVGG